MTRNQQDKVFKTYQDVQLVKQAEITVSQQHTEDLANNWKDGNIPALQRKVVDIQLDNLKRGYVDPVFSSLLTALKEIELTTFSLLDAACASGYYAEVIKNLDKRPIDYKGCDYSEAMIEAARAYYPEVDFQVQDLTQLDYPNRSVDVVLVSGVLEHIPDYQQAIREACRVAKSYLIIHRCPLTLKSDHVYTIGAQYNIHTPRIYFSKEKLVKELQKQRFSLIKQIDIVYDQKNFLQKIKLLVKKAILWDKIRRKEDTTAKVQTLVFKSER